MELTRYSAADLAAVHGIVRATVVAFDREHALVRCRTPFDEGLACDVLHVGGCPRYAPGDVVLICFPAGDATTPVIIGRIGQSLAEAIPSPCPDMPDEILIEAKHELTFRCGDGSITIRADGKILIKGKDLISHAQNVNRIKGGAVAIN